MLQVPTLFYTLDERPHRPHEKHDNTSLSQELKQEFGLNSHGFGQIGVFTVRTTPPVHNVSYELTHGSSPFSSELEKGGYIARKACASTSYFYNLFTYNGGVERSPYNAGPLEAEPELCGLPLERFVSAARISARRGFTSFCEKQVGRADPQGRSTPPLAPRAARG